MNSGKNRIVVVGSINTDLVVTTDRLPQTGETITGGSLAIFQGGKGANQAVAASRLGADVTLIAKVGSDSFGETSLRELAASGVNCEHVGVEPGDSGVAVISVATDGRNTIVVIPGANALVSVDFIESKRSVIREAGIVLSQLEIPMDSVARLAEICREEGVPFMLDPAPATLLPAGLLEQTTWFTPNETESAFYAPNAELSSTPDCIAAALKSCGANNLILKRGERGAYLICSDSPPLSVDAIRVNAVDTTAAGDTYNGAFAAAIVSGKSIEQCARLAAAAAAISVTRSGAQASMPTSVEVEKLASGNPG